MKTLVPLLLFLPLSMLAQSTTENYIKSTTYKVATKTGNVAADQQQESITYYDGLGRPKQQIAVQAGGQQQDIITHIGYDAFGRQDKEYLPYAASTNKGAFRSGDLENMTNEFYQDKYPKDFAGVSLENVNAYSQKVFDNSPLNRVLEQAAPGKDWKVGNGHTIKFDYQTNISNEVLNFGVNFTKNDPASPKLTIADSYYNSSTLYKTITKDENWRSHDHTDKTTEEFKNKQEQVVLKRTYNKNVAHDTYYVYDDYGNLSYVIPPLASEKTIVYQTGMKSYPASKFVTGGNPTGTIKFGIQKIAPGKYAYVADFNLHNLANSNFKSGEIMELPLIYSTMKNFWLSCAWVSSGGSYAYVYYYVKNGKLFCNTYVSNRDNISLKIKDFDKTTQQDFPQNLQGFSPAVSQAKMKELLDKLCHQYKYDTRNRLIQKKIPGKGWEYIVYDKLDRPVLTQDANLRASKKWLFTKYDVFGRVAYTGIYTHHKTLSQKQMQTHFEAVNNTAPKYYETKLTTAGSLGIYYNSKNFPTTNLEVYTVNYYDNYTFNRAGTGTSVRNVYGINSTTRLKGLPTGSKVKVLDTNDWITTITYYDDKARPIYVYAKNDYLLSSDIVKSKLDFVGRVIETTSIHTKIDDNLPTITTIDKFEYDHVGRLKKQTQKIGGQAEEVIVANTYNELGKLIKKGVGNTYSSPLQEVDYSYNVRGWLKMINDPKAGLGEKLFSMELLYNDPGDNLRNTKLYNGNISQSIWKTASDNSKRYYNYYYDDLNRIKWAKYYSWNQYYRFNGSFSYDKNGNLLQLYRRGAVVENPEVRNARDYGTMDYLNYTYNGNQLTKVKDTGKKQYGFIDGADTDQEYRYDLNGNMIADANKGIQEIKYNHLNLPTLVDFGNNKSIEYTYDATGTKIRKRVENLSAFTNTDYAGNYIYENNELQFFNHSEGYATPNNLGKFDYIYQYKDHLGNVRLSYTKNHDIDIPETIFTDNATNTQGWNSIGAKYGSSASIATDKSYSGGKSFKIHSTTGNDRYAHSNKWIAIDNNEETEYTFSGRVFVESSGYAWGRISFFMNENDETKYFTEVFDGDAIKTKGKWVYYEKTVTVPANIDKINLRIGLYHQTNNATAWFDDLKIVKGNRSRTTIVEESNYYPFGLKHKGYNNVVNGVENNHKTFLGQEMNKELGLNWLTFRYRNYMPEIGRFFGVDPISEDYMSISTYQFAHNNPVWKIEIEGLEGESTTIPDKINKEPIKRTVTTVGTPTFKQDNRTTAERASDFKRGKKIYAERQKNKKLYSRPPSEWVGADRSKFIMTGVAYGMADIATGQVIGKLFRGASILKSAISSSSKTRNTVVVIGEGMGRVKGAASALKTNGIKNVEVFSPSSNAMKQWDKLTKGGVHLSDEAVKGTKLYKENQAWIKKAHKSGKTILDIGNDGRKKTSTFYRMEQQTVYGAQ